MEPQAPAQGILLHKDYGDSKFYTVSCDCGDDSDNIKLEVEADDNDVTVHIWRQVHTPYWDDTWRKRYDINNELLQFWHWAALDLANGFIRRIKLTWKLWTKGYLEYESWTILNRQQAINLSEALKSAVDDVTEFRKARNGKQ